MRHIQLTLFCLCLMLSSLYSTRAWSDDDSQGIGPNAAENLIADTEFLSSVGELYLQQIEIKLANKPSFEELTGIKKALRQASFSLAKASVFTDSMTRIAFLKYPDVLVARLGIFLGFGALSIALTSTGHAAWAAIPEIPGFQMGLTGVYFLVRKWMSVRHLSHELMINPDKIEKFKAEVFTDVDVKSISLHFLPSELGGTVIPVAQQKIFHSKDNYESQDFIPIRELEEMVGSADFVIAAQKLNLDSAFYVNLLKDKILSDPTARETLISRANSLNLQRENKSWGPWIKESEAFISRMNTVVLEQMLDMSRLVKAETSKLKNLSFAVRQELLPLAQRVLPRSDNKLVSAIFAGLEKDDRDTSIPNYADVYFAANAERKALFKLVHELEFFQLSTLAAVLRGEKVDRDLAQQNFETKRTELLIGFDSFNVKYPALTSLNKVRTLICKELFAD